MLAPRPAARPTLAFLKFLLGPADPAVPGYFLLGILDPTDELVPGQRCDVRPGIECGGVGEQRLAQVFRQFVYHPTGHSETAHGTTVTGQA